MPASLAAVVHPFSVAGRASVAGLIHETTIELLARAVHQAYRRSTPASGGPEERLREDNCDHARRWSKTRPSRGCRWAHWSYPCAASNSTWAEIEVLSGLEHERWRWGERHRRSRSPEFSPDDRPWPELTMTRREPTRWSAAGRRSLRQGGLQIDRDPRRLRPQQALNAWGRRRGNRQAGHPASPGCAGGARRGNRVRWSAGCGQRHRGTGARRHCLLLTARAGSGSRTLA